MNEVELAEKLSDHKHRIGSLEHRMEKAEFKIRSVCFSGCCFWHQWDIRCTWPLPMQPLTGMMRIM